VQVLPGFELHSLHEETPMRPEKYLVVLTGPAAAALHELDGFRERIWPHRYTTFHGGRREEGLIRTRKPFEPVAIGNVLVAPIWLVLRHLNSYPIDLLNCDDGLAARDRVELAVEHARRDGVKLKTTLGGSDSGNAMLRDIRALIGIEPPTESYAETRLLQTLRGWDINPWRQICISVDSKDYRVDFVVPARRIVRPEVFRPVHGLIVEADSKQWHEGKFEEDRARWNAFDRAGFHWISVTPNMAERRPAQVRAGIEGALLRAGFSKPPTRTVKTPNLLKKVS
jgi:very-short-patch-repair endonuclease